MTEENREEPSPSLTRDDEEQEEEEEEPPLTFARRVIGLRRNRRLYGALVLALPYVVGVVWHYGWHPSCSVLTGDFRRPRRLYVDENSAEPYYFRVRPSRFRSRDRLLASSSSSSSSSRPPVTTTITSLCQAVSAVVGTTSNNNNRGNAVCRPLLFTSSTAPSRRRVAVEVLQITPPEGPVTVRTEALVLVVPSSEDWMTSPLHTAFLSFLVELLQSSSWLAKTVFVVASSRGGDDGAGDALSVTQTVKAFLDAYLGPSTDDDIATSYSWKESIRTRNDPSLGNGTVLPAGITSSALLRQLIVWDQELIDDNDDDDDMRLPMIRILPQGPRGLLPNMDLVSVVRAALQQTVATSSSPKKKNHNNVHLEIHPHQRQSRELRRSLDRICRFFSSLTHDDDDDARRRRRCPEPYTTALLNLVWFQHALRGQRQRQHALPHGAALARGVDALTVQWVGRRRRNDNDDVQKLFSAAMEITVRALSNLHERLHHSTSLYLLIDIDHFVKHEEYLVPNLLLLVPLIVRAVTVLWVDVKPGSWDWTAVGLVLERTLLWTLGVACSLELMDYYYYYHDDNADNVVDDDGDLLTMRHVVVGLAYLSLLLAGWRRDEGRSAVRRQSIQCVACFWALYTHVAIAFGHVSLAFPSALLWTPLLAFPHYQDDDDDVKQPPTTWRRIRNGASRVVGIVVVIALMPCVWLVPNVIPSYTPYVCFAYIPLHLMLSQMVLS